MSKKLKRHYTCPYPLVDIWIVSSAGGDNHYQAHQQVSFVMANSQHLDALQHDTPTCRLPAFWYVQ